ncbi:hypothetical protein COOONC_12730 [Cooperia oncophora]
MRALVEVTRPLAEVMRHPAEALLAEVALMEAVRVEVALMEAVRVEVALMEAVRVEVALMEVEVKEYKEEDKLDTTARLEAVPLKEADPTMTEVKAAKAVKAETTVEVNRVK